MIMNPFRGEFTFEALGQKWTMVLDMNALAAFEAETGKKALQVIDEMADENNVPSITELIALCWAGLQRHHPDATTAIAGDILSECPEAVMGGITNSMGGEEEASTPGKPKP